MAEWRMPVFDRTMDDVKSVDRTSAAYQKGTLNADDLNRIEDNYKYLMAKLRGDAIFIPHRLRNYAETVIKTVEMEVSTSKLPDGYTEVEYIQSSGGTQYIDTGFKPNQNTRVIIDCDIVSYVTTNILVYGCRKSKGSNGFYGGATSTVISFGYGNQHLTSNGSLLGRKLIDHNKSILSVNGEAVFTFTAETFQTEYNLYLFATNSAGMADSQRADVKVYSCKIYDDGTLVRNFVPCTNTSGETGLYDLVNGVFYDNAGTGTFTVGTEIEGEIESVYELIETKTTYTDWQEHNLPWLSEINRIRANYNALVRLFLVGLGFSEQPENNYLDYTEVNNWESIALVGKVMFENMEKEYRYCGMEESGGERLL